MFKVHTCIPGLAVMLLTGVAHADIHGHTCSDPHVGATTPSSAFTVVGDGSIVRHGHTALEWKRCAEGQSWNAGQASCDGSVTGYSWQEALQEGNAQDGWRLPNINELRSIVEQCSREPAINGEVFPDTPSFRFWSASPVANDAVSAWYIHFNAGHNNHAWDKDKSQHLAPVGVRLVRDSE